MGSRTLIAIATPLALGSLLSGCPDGGSPATDSNTTAAETTAGTPTSAPTTGDTSTTGAPVTTGATTGTATTGGATTGTATTGAMKVDKRAFVTAATFHGDLMQQGGGADGITGADILCQDAAVQAGVGGTWVAWVSTSSVDAITRLADDGRWTLIDGTTEVFAAKSEIQFGPSHAIDQTETGAALLPSRDPVVVWTNTDRFGRNSEAGQNNACDDWTGQTGIAAVGVLFDPANGGPGLHWTDTQQPRGCGDSLHIYCMEP